MGPEELTIVVRANVLGCPLPLEIPIAEEYFRVRNTEAALLN